MGGILLGKLAHDEARSLFRPKCYCEDRCGSDESAVIGKEVTMPEHLVGTVTQIFKVDPDAA